jgi:hypothetical protein
MSADMADKKPTPKKSLKQALNDHAAEKKAAEDFKKLHEHELAAQLEEQDAITSQLNALPQDERRKVLDDAGLNHVSAAPRPLNPLPPRHAELANNSPAVPEPPPAPEQAKSEGKSAAWDGLSLEEKRASLDAMTPAQRREWAIEQAKKHNDNKRKRPAPPPPETRVTGGAPTFRFKLKEPDWDNWRHMLRVTLWDAVNLWCNIEPSSREPYGGTVCSIDNHLLEEFTIRLKIAESHMAAGRLPEANKYGYSGRPKVTPVNLPDFAAWAKGIGKSIPNELADIVHSLEATPEIEQTQQPPPATIESPPAPEQAKSEGQEESAVTDHAADEELAALFDSVSVAALAKMFPDEKWPVLAERAARNGLSVARTERGLFNPYRAAIWWLKKQKPLGWDLAHVYRTLGKNLPARSLDSKHLVTGEIE